MRKTVLGSGRVSRPGSDPAAPAAGHVSRGPAREGRDREFRERDRWPYRLSRAMVCGYTLLRDGVSHVFSSSVTSSRQTLALPSR